jgi:hypothetical protein
MESWASILSLTLPARKYLVTHFYYRLSGPQDHCMRTEGWKNFKISKDPTGNRAQDFIPRGALPKPTTPLLPSQRLQRNGKEYDVPHCTTFLIFFNFLCLGFKRASSTSRRQCSTFLDLRRVCQQINTVPRHSLYTECLNNHVPN